MKERSVLCGKLVISINRIGLIPLTDPFSKISIEVNIEASVPSVFYGDRRRLETVLFHLLWNAGKYSQYGSSHFRTGNLTIGVMKKPETITFYVSDNGIGISDERKRKLFRLVSRDVLSPINRKNHSRRQMLCGLGLTICQMICKEMGTELQVDSQEGIGSTFSFEIPFHISDEKLLTFEEDMESDYFSEEMEERKAEIRLPTYNCQGSRLLTVKKSPSNRRQKLQNSLSVRRFLSQPMRNEWVILIVDDCSTNRIVLRSLVKKFNKNWQIFEASNGQQALEWVEAWEKHSCPEELMILMDVDMPIMDGIEATRLIRALPLKKRVLISSITAFDSPEIRASCKKAGMDYCYRKPFRFSDLQKLMTDVNSF